MIYCVNQERSPYNKDVRRVLLQADSSADGLPTDGKDVINLPDTVQFDRSSILAVLDPPTTYVLANDAKTWKKWH